MNIAFSVRSHKGNTRISNEDNFFANGVILPQKFRNNPFSIDADIPVPVILAVCDGMGGEEHGEMASEIAVKKLSEFQYAFMSSLPHDLNKTVQICIEAANNEISSYHMRSGTTIALAVISKKGVYCFNVGDSRIYTLCKGFFKQVTNDHTQGAEIARSRIISAERARHEKNGNKLIRCIGFGNCYNAESYPVIKERCRLLICSDGLTDMVSDTEIKNILCTAEKISEAADKLLKSALNHGGKDNVTLITADISGNSFVFPIRKKFRRQLL
ncbi:MAG: protein phosphatase 2C domain-containing protein [Eubacterium sp.]|nr:protein phosphatase 2C domain-containing protein [Eubacterium sp.]